MSLLDAKMQLGEGWQKLLPDDQMEYYSRTDQMHCDRTKSGGSKFLSEEDGGVDNIFDVLKKVDDGRVRQRADDREALKAVGAPDSAFLPATKGQEHPTGLPEALYFKVDGIKGKLGIVKLSELSPETAVVVEREKGLSNPGDKQYTPSSFTTYCGRLENLPDTDFATVIVGRGAEPGAKDSVWTIHPGAPIKPALRDADWSKGLKSPQELAGGQPRQAIVTTVAKLLEFGLKPEDYIKVVSGDKNQKLEGYDVRQI